DAGTHSKRRLEGNTKWCIGHVLHHPSRAACQLATGPLIGARGSFSNCSRGRDRFRIVTIS
ncbi:MAG: hypothetical protein P4M11_14455, partial [Candidatus Pacebacteria bacterium]|nr:hypothetical protein [Candidatus Paceibacterota bacterium]